MQIRDGFVGTVGKTPLIKLRRASEETECTILGKAEFLNPGGSVKDRAALYIIKDAEERGLLRRGGVIVEGTAGNTGIGLALVGNARGYRTVIVMPETQSQEKKDMLLLRRRSAARAGGALCQPDELCPLFRAPRRGNRRRGAERRDLGQPVRQPRQPARPLRDDGPRDLGGNRRQSRRVYVLGRDRRHAFRRRDRAQGAQPQRQDISIRLHGLGHLQLVRASRVQAGGQLDHRRHRQQPRNQEPRRVYARWAIPDNRRGNAADPVQPGARGGAGARRLDRHQSMRCHSPRAGTRTRPHDRDGPVRLRHPLSIQALQSRIPENARPAHPALAVKKYYRCPGASRDPPSSARNVLRLSPREPTIRNPVYRVDLGPCAAGVEAQAESRPRGYRKIRRRSTGLVRASRHIGSSDATGKADQELEARLSR